MRYARHHKEEQEILGRLLSQSDSIPDAWREFLQRYSNLFLKIIWQFEKDRDRVMDIYLQVCTKFARNEFAVLRTFNAEFGQNPPTFTTWLGAIVRNVCIDVHRGAHGRRRFPKALLRLSDFERRVFDFHYWRGYSYEEIEQRLSIARNGKVADALERIEQVLARAPGHGREEFATPVFVPYHDDISGVTPVEEETIPDEETVGRWLRVLDPLERLAVRLRFWEDMPASEIADVLHVVPKSRIYTILKNALATLRAHAVTFE